MFETNNSLTTWHPRQHKTPMNTHPGRGGLGSPLPPGEWPAAGQALKRYIPMQRDAFRKPRGQIWQNGTNACMAVLQFATCRHSERLQCKKYKENLGDWQNSLHLAADVSSTLAHTLATLHSPPCTRLQKAGPRQAPVPLVRRPQSPQLQRDRHCQPAIHGRMLRQACKGMGR